MALKRYDNIIQDLACQGFLDTQKPKFQQGMGKGIALALANSGVKVAVNYFDWAEERTKLKTVRYIIKNAPFMTGAVLRLDGGYVLGGKETGDMPKGVL
jgi:hypothetical protein